MFNRERYNEYIKSKTIENQKWQDKQNKSSERYVILFKPTNCFYNGSDHEWSAIPLKLYTLRGIYGFIKSYKNNIDDFQILKVTCNYDSNIDDKLKIACAKAMFEGI